ncbi:polysaccharide deacetylase family protein [Streptomyces sp. NBC_00335]|uniref:polysaccharide deacetylase family protein n=1 Tax=unclassified Streptomyces TaxID=2593676 RepID=UPI002254A391|nr:MULTISPECIES: polysaccharide deacetylase family protein [unclassified Streptomyces]MCX5406684.1 polysaccharide deacetylase family protein [Streptomyces sp. NBC_00086]
MSADTETAPRAAAAPARRTGAPWVLMYHSVAEFTDPAEDPYGITVTPHALEAQLLWLRSRELRGVSVGELLRARAAGRGAGLVGLTFDDGYTDFLTRALPLLRRYDCTATLFVLPGRLGVDNVWDPLGPRKPLLTAEGIREVAAAGQEIGSHGLLHQDLTAAPDDVLAQELRGSRELIRELTGTLPAGFCYPYGHLDARVVAATRAAGYGYACAIDPGRLAGPHAMPRTHISQADGGPRLRIKQVRHQVRELRRAVHL